MDLRRLFLMAVLAAGAMLLAVTVYIFHDRPEVRAHLESLKGLIATSDDRRDDIPGIVYAGNGTKIVNLSHVGHKVDLSPEQNPLFSEVGEPEGTLRRPGEAGQVPAALISLVRNRELKDLVGSITQLEGVFNDKFNYPWIFFNDEEFTDEFKEKVKKATSSNCTFVKIDSEDWEEPEWIDREKARLAGVHLKEVEHVQHGDEASYHRMCRWNSGKFYEHPVLDGYKYYWRVEPKTNYYCTIDYDVFAYMDANDKDYGFVINIYDSPQSVRSLWNATEAFLKLHPDYIHPNNALQWLINSKNRDRNQVAGYSTCHFWSNFEIGRLDFFRSQAYRDYFEYLDRDGGFFYERWGDAPVHSVALGLMADKSRIHWFRDIGYFHGPYYNCPKSSQCSGCQPGLFSESQGIRKENCISEWFKVAGTG